MKEMLAANCRLAASALLMVSALAIGGSASRPDFELALTALALACLLTDLWLVHPIQRNSIIKWIILLVAIVPMLQLIPLPEFLWTTLPQAEVARNLPLGAPDATFRKTLTINPDSTLYSFLVTIPALVALWMASGLSRRDQTILLGLFVIGVISSAILGIFQSAGGMSMQIYQDSHRGVATGLFASRNHFVDLLILGVPVVFYLSLSYKIAENRSLIIAALCSMSLILFASVIGSASRTGLILFASTFLVCTILYIEPSTRLRFSFLSLAAIAFLGSALYLAPKTGYIKVISDRLSTEGEARWEIWRNSLEAAKMFLPWGSGSGTFTQAYMITEPLKSMRFSYINAAHNEYLQFFLENGYIFIAQLMILALIFLKIIARRDTSRQVLLLAVCFSAIIVHSLDDYPFRVLALNIPFSILVGCILGKLDTCKNRAFQG
ncbi:O-antigen ligase family protein [Novosphingobium cyanobacteriorum]|uniref:O-antigen ligase family protein n=1 Tax=Novosphingobium cyanobacteriorum TaxID=3024215 RepID=A0ABT6CM41_9SPHN|nr:O-antigen ligase family protein [Novosphingobium cyanobacteriorum]MDF8334987.1 O-antigen ligase family protein [Novosphingobium cyanobacteriorum]